MAIYQTTYTTPLGTMHICCTETAISSALFVAPDAFSWQDEHPLLAACTQQLSEYFEGSREHFNLPLMQAGTPFQQQAWELLYNIPFGKTISYLDMAKSYGQVKAIRALAAANGKNKIAIIVPCHRVIGTNQSLTGYAGGLWRKKWLLEHESRGTGGVQTLF